MGFYLKIAGVTFDNRQSIIKTLQQGQKLILVRESFNPHDRNAVAVKTTDGNKIGYISRENNRSIAYQLDQGRRFDVVVSAVTGGTYGHNYGVNIYLTQK